MRQAVRDGFVSFTAPLEGVVPWMYADVKGLITTAIGNLIDPIAFALPLPWVRPDGSPAGRDEVAAEWLRVKNDPTMARLGHLASEKITSLRLTPEGVDLVVSRKLSQMDQHIAGRFADWDSYPADCQLAMLSQAWALGPGWNFPLMLSAIRARDFALAGHECTIYEHGNPGVIPRNRANRVLWRNAAYVERYKLDPDVLYWPKDLHSEDDTQPELPVLSDPDEDRESKDEHVFPSIIPKSAGIFEAVAELTGVYRRKRDDEEK